MTYSPQQLLDFMREALIEAESAALRGEVPIGAVVVCDGAIVSRAGNEVEHRQEATAHAELLALNRASNTLNRWRLQDCLLVSTLEPCSMCAGAALQSRISQVVFGATDPKAGAFGSLYDLTLLPGQAAPRIISGIESERALLLLREFFQERR